MTSTGEKMVQHSYVSSVRIWAWNSWPNNQHAAKFPHALTTNLTRSMTHMGQMMAPKPLIIII
jgi:hypothetical protein